MSDIHYSLTKLLVADSTYTDQISLSDVKAHLRVSWSTENTAITNILKAAYSICSEYIGLSIIASEYTLFMDRFPNANEDSWFLLPYSCGETTISGLKYYGTDNVEVIWDASDIATYLSYDSTRTTWVRVYPSVGKTFPSTASRPAAFNISYDTGYKDAGTSENSLPNDIRAAILLMVGNLYENRQDNIVGRITSELPMTAKHLLNPYRTLKL